MTYFQSASAKALGSHTRRAKKSSFLCLIFLHRAETPAKGHQLGWCFAGAPWPLGLSIFIQHRQDEQPCHWPPAHRLARASVGASAPSPERWELRVRTERGCGETASLGTSGHSQTPAGPREDRSLDGAENELGVRSDSPRVLPGEAASQTPGPSGPRRRVSEGLHASRNVSAQPGRPEPGSLLEGLAVLT